MHNYTQYNGKKKIRRTRKSIGLAKTVSEDWANLLLNEKVQISIDKLSAKKKIETVLADNQFDKRANQLVELVFALGTGALVEYMDGDAVKIDYVRAGMIYPLSWDNGIIRECAFVSEERINGKDYTYFQIHWLEDGKYTIENHIFEYSREVELSSVPGYENVPVSIRTNSEEPQFIIDRMNIANPNAENPMGISIFANAIDQLKGVDIAYDGYVNEFVLGKKRIVVKPEATKDLNGKPVFDARETVYYVLPEDGSNGSVMEPVDMTLRTKEFNEGMQDMLNMLSSKCGFGENHYKFDRGSISTATQIVSENSTLFRTIKKHELILRDVLVQLCRTILRMGNQYMNAELNEDVEISIDFDDSIIEDKESDFNRDCRLLQMGIMNDWEFRMKWMNEDEETAKAALPQMEKLVSDE